MERLNESLNDFSRYVNRKRLPEPDDNSSVIVDKTFPEKNRYAAFSYVFKNLSDDYDVQPLIEIEDTRENIVNINSELFKTDNIKNKILKNFITATYSNFNNRFNEPYSNEPIIQLDEKNSNLDEIKKFIKEKNVNKHLFNKGYIPSIKINREITDAVLKYNDSEILGSNLITEVPIYFILKGVYDEAIGHVSTFIYFKKKFYSLGFLADDEDNTIIPSIDNLLFYNKTIHNYGYEREFNRYYNIIENTKLINEFGDVVRNGLLEIKTGIGYAIAEMNKDNVKYYNQTVKDETIKSIYSTVYDDLMEKLEKWELTFGTLRFYIEFIKIIEKVKQAESSIPTKRLDKSIENLYNEFISLLTEKKDDLLNNLASSPFTGNYIIDIGILTQFHIDNINMIIDKIDGVNFNLETYEEPGKLFLSSSLLRYKLKSKYGRMCVMSDFKSKGNYEDTSSATGRSSKLLINPRNTTVSRKTLSKSNCTNNTTWVFSDSIHCIGRGGINPSSESKWLPVMTDNITIPGACAHVKLQKINEDGSTELLLKEIDYSKIEELPNFLKDETKTIDDFIVLFDTSPLSLTLHLSAIELHENKKTYYDKLKGIFNDKPAPPTSELKMPEKGDKNKRHWSLFWGGSNKNYLLNKLKSNCKRKTNKRKSNKRKTHKRKTK